MSDAAPNLMLRLREYAAIGAIVGLFPVISQAIWLIRIRVNRRFEEIDDDRRGWDGIWAAGLATSSLLASAVLYRALIPEAFEEPQRFRADGDGSPPIAKYVLFMMAHVVGQTVLMVVAGTVHFVFERSILPRAKLTPHRVRSLLAYALGGAVVGMFASGELAANARVAPGWFILAAALLAPAAAFVGQEVATLVADRDDERLRTR